MRRRVSSALTKDCRESSISAISCSRRAAVSSSSAACCSSCFTFIGFRRRGRWAEGGSGSAACAAGAGAFSGCGSGSGGCALVHVYQEEIHLSRYDVAERETRYLRTEHFGHQNGNASHHNTTRMIIDFAHRLRDGLGAIHSAADSLKTTRLGFAADAAVQEALKTGWTSGVVSL